MTWARQALSLRPPEAANISSTQVDDWANAAYGRITALLPQMPSYTPTLATQINSATSSSNTAVMSYIVDVGELGTPAAVRFADDQVDAYRELQEKHQRPARVRSILVARFPTDTARFDAAVTAYRHHLALTGSDAAVAIEIRTLIDGVKGSLFQEARSSPGENMTWPLMAQRLGRDTSHRIQLEQQETSRATLYGHLSSVAKRRAPVVTLTVDSLWSMCLDHLQAVLS